MKKSNMKFLLLVICALLAFSKGEASEALEKLKAESRNIAIECAKESGATDDDVDNFMGRSALQSQPAHCMLFCFAKRAGSLDADGKYNDAGTKAFFEPLKNSDAELYDKLLAIAAKCEKEVDTNADPCTTASKFYECSLKTEKEMMR